MAFGILERGKAAQSMSEINMTPLIDVMLVLLVIFMLAAPLLVSMIKVDLPRQTGAALAAQAAHVDVTLDAGGLSFNGAAVTFKANAIDLVTSGGDTGHGLAGAPNTGEPICVGCWLKAAAEHQALVKL